MGRIPADTSLHEHREPFSVQHSEILCLIGFHATHAADLAGKHKYGYHLDRHLERIQDWAGVLASSNAHTGTTPEEN